MQNLLSPVRLLTVTADVGLVAGVCALVTDTMFTPFEQSTAMLALILLTRTAPPGRSR
jgi:hypothetical protein